MLYAGLDLSRHRLDVHVMNQAGQPLLVTAAPPDADGLRGLARQVVEFGQPVAAAIESMNGARFVHDQLEFAGWQVAIADAQKVKGLAPLACKTDRIDATLLAFGKPCGASDLFGAGGRRLLDQLEVPAPWAGTLAAAVQLIDDLDERVAGCERELRRLGADHPYVPLLMTAPGIAWVLGYTIAAELGDIGRFPSPKKLCGYTGLCPRVYQSGDRDHRGPLAK